jgi:hypothetical protein
MTKGLRGCTETRFSLRQSGCSHPSVADFSPCGRKIGNKET